MGGEGGGRFSRPLNPPLDQSYVVSHSMQLEITGQGKIMLLSFIASYTLYNPYEDRIRLLFSV